MSELGTLNWWKSRYWRSRKQDRRLARAFHSAYHHLIAHAPQESTYSLTDRDGRLREIVVSYLDMQLAVQRALAWCSNHIAAQEYGHAYAMIARRLPRVWAVRESRRRFAMTAFLTLCKDKCWLEGDEQKAAQRLAIRSGRSIWSIHQDKLDFFLMGAAAVLDNDAWEDAMNMEVEEL